MAHIKGTNVGSPVVPFDTGDQNPSHEAIYGRGGYRTVATTAARDAIPAPRREAGMLVHVTADGVVYELAGDLTTWGTFTPPPGVHLHVAADITDFTTAVAAVSPPASWDTLTGKPSTFPPSSHTHDDRYYTQAQADSLLAGKQASGSYATLVGGKVPSSQLPTIVTSWNDLTDKPTLGTAAAANTTDFAPAGSYATLVGGTVPDSQIASSIARTSDVTSAVAAVVGAAPSSLDTLRELAQALGDDANFASTVTNALAGKVGTTDSRLTDAREWTADTVSQAEAEAGTATTRRAWTAVRVWQAIAAWWATVASTKQDTLPSGTTGNVLTYSSGAWTAAAPAFDGSYTSLSNVPSAFTPASHNQAWSTITSTPTTLSGYGITDACSSTDSRLSDTRTPTDGSVTTAKLADGSVTASKLASSQSPTFTTVNASSIGGAADFFVGTKNAVLGSTVVFRVNGLGVVSAGEWKATAIDVAHGGTGATTAADARTNLGLGTLATQSGTFSGTSSGVNTGDQTISLTGDVTGSGTGTFAATIANGAITDAKIASGGLSASSVNWVGITAWAPSTAYAKGDLVHYLGVAYRRSAAGTSGSSFTSANWQQVTPPTYTRRSDVVSSTSYTGVAASGSATSASVWTIRKTVYTSAGAVSSTATATNAKWDDRLTASYS